MQFYYVMDPMCAWCYGFEPELESFMQSIEKLEKTMLMFAMNISKHMIKVQLYFALQKNCTRKS